MKFRTEYNPEIASELLYPSMPAVLIGSCFTDSIGAGMRDCRWPSVANPCGVLYNPASIANLLTMSVNIDKESVRKEIMHSIIGRDGFLCRGSLIRKSTERRKRAWPGLLSTDCRL